MDVLARPAEPDDLPDLLRLYRLLEEELTGLKAVWPYTEALPEPVEPALRAALDAHDTILLVGSIDAVPFGFLLGVTRPLLPQAEGAAVAEIRYLFTEEAAREVGVAEVLMEAFVADRRAAGIRHFDAHVSPGHRLAKNFFESNGFKARHIVMHHEDSV
jgi:GNAT superfamily N-acetyltransferase